MAEPAQADQLQANSPARQLLAALSKASQEMEQSVNDSFDYIETLNTELERVVNAHIDEVNAKSEALVRAQLSSIQAEKDSILSQLSELRQEELKVLQNTGRELRQAVLEKLESTISSFSKEVEEHLKVFQDQLAGLESESNSAVETGKKSLKDVLPLCLDSINTEVSREKGKLEELNTAYEEKLSQESSVSLNQLLEHSNELKTRLELESEEFRASVEQKAGNLSSKQSDALKERIQGFAKLEEIAGQRLESATADDLGFIKNLTGSFADSCTQMTEIQVALHSTTVKSMALQYRTEILSAAQAAEDQLQIVKADIQALLRNYQNHYAEQFEAVLSKFERAANELASTQQGAPAESHANNEEITESMNSYFANLKKNISDNMKEQLASTEAAMEKSYEDFRNVLEKARKHAADKTEASFKQSQDELSKLQQSNEEQLHELNKKLEELEQAVNEAKDLISALDQASLDF